MLLVPRREQSFEGIWFFRLFDNDGNRDGISTSSLMIRLDIFLQKTKKNIAFFLRCILIVTGNCNVAFQTHISHRIAEFLFLRGCSLSNPDEDFISPGIKDHDIIFVQILKIRNNFVKHFQFKSSLYTPTS
jgi:hypothetical protein